MASSASGIFVDSCQYTPIYFVENPSITQASPYIVAQSTQDIQKPVSDNLKKFYENSGKLETNLCSFESSCRPRILKKPDSNQVGNNLKLASFLLPKPEPNVCSTQMTVQASNVLMKPVYIANTPNIVNNSPRLDVQSKIVQLKEMTNVTRTLNGKIVPKTKPKENVTNNKHTSVQLLKLGDSYHSLNRLSEEQMRIVNHALKIFNNPKEVPQKPKYDPVTNTKFIYKVVSSKDIAVAGDNNLFFAHNKPECVFNKNNLLPSQNGPESLNDNGLLLTNKSTEAVSKQGKLVTKKKIEHLGKNVLLFTNKKQEHMKKNGLLVTRKQPVESNGLFLGQEKVEFKTRKNNVLSKKSENIAKEKSILNMKTSQNIKTIKMTDSKKTEVKNKIEREDAICETNSNIPIFLENAVTRSGRKVRISKYILQDTLDKPKKKVSYVASCSHCSLKFSSTYRLQRHYEFNPTHSPHKVHSNLYQCFLSVVKGNSKDNGANIFLDQLQQFITKLRSCLPCLVQADNDFTEGPSSFINDDISRLLGISPGKYKINTSGLDCEKDLNGHCKHNTPKQKHKEGTTGLDPSQEHEKVVNEPIIEKVKLPIKKSELRRCKPEEISNTKKVKLNPTEVSSSLSADDIVKALLSDSLNTNDLNETNGTGDIKNDKLTNKTYRTYQSSKANHIQFRSTHFDIRSSPIKTSTSSFSKFQINTENVSQYKVHLIQPLKLSPMCNNTNIDSSTSLPKQLFNENIDKNVQTTEQSSNNWPCKKIDTDDIMFDSLIEESHIIKPAYTHTNDVSGPNQEYRNSDIIMPDQILSDQDNAIDALHFLESLGNECIYPETEIRNNTVDFHLDLF